MCVKLASEDTAMNDNVLRFCKFMVTDDCHVTCKEVVPFKPTMNCLPTEQTRRATAGCDDGIRTDQCSRKVWREVRVDISVPSGSATAQEAMTFRKDTCAKSCFKPNRRWMELGVGAIIPKSVSTVGT